MAISGQFNGVGTFSRSDFIFGWERNEYGWPNGEALRTTVKVHDGRTILHRAGKSEGLAGARDELHLAAVVQNLKTLANHIRRPPPSGPAPAMA